VSERPAGGAPELPPDVPPEYADAYLRGYERAYAEAAGLAAAAPLPGQSPSPEPESMPEPVDAPTEPWQFEPPEEPGEPEPPRTWAFEPPGRGQEPGVDEGGDDEPADGDPETGERADTAEQPAVDPDDEPGQVVPGFVLWEGRDERYDEPPDVEGHPRWVMPFLALCLIVLLFVAIYLLA